MTLEQRTRLTILYDLYSGLLTERQRDAFDLYYQCDLSFGEIAAEQQVSRAAVHDLVRRATHLLEQYEEKLHLAERELERYKMLEALRDAVGDNAEALALLAQLGLKEV